MDCRTFIVQILNILIWPTLILTIVFYFKEELKKLINSISELKIGNFSIAIEKRVLAHVLQNPNFFQETSSEKPELTREEILNIPDEDYEFMQKIANNTNFLPTSENEVFKYNSLVNHGYFVQHKDGAYEPTTKGDEIIKALKSIYYS